MKIVEYKNDKSLCKRDPILNDHQFRPTYQESKNRFRFNQSLMINKLKNDMTSGQIDLSRDFFVFSFKFNLVSSCLLLWSRADLDIDIAVC